MTVAHLLTPEMKAKASLARKAAKPRVTGYAAVGRRGEPLRLVHRVRAEKALGRVLPKGVEVHHADGSKRADAPLVICENAAYHRLLHNRMRIKAAGGDPNTQKLCSRCKALKSRNEFNRNERYSCDGLDYFCRQCVSEKNALQRVRRKAAAA